MIRLGFTGRLFIIFVTGLVAVQLLAVLAFFLQRSRDTDTGLRMPLPDQAAALVELLESTPGPPDPSELGAIAARHGLEVERESISRLTEQHGLRWGPPASES